MLPTFIYFSWLNCISCELRLTPSSHRSRDILIHFFFLRFLDLAFSHIWVTHLICNVYHNFILFSSALSTSSEASSQPVISSTVLLSLSLSHIHHLCHTHSLFLTHTLTRSTCLTRPLSLPLSSTHFHSHTSPHTLFFPFSTLAPPSLSSLS